jgi:hypothetical protein
MFYARLLLRQDHRLLDRRLFPKESPAWWEQVSAVPPLLERAALKSLPVIPTQ